MRQKNTIDGSDIAELLLKDRKDIHLPYASNKAKLVVMVYLYPDVFRINFSGKWDPPFPYYRIRVSVPSILERFDDA